MLHLSTIRRHYNRGFQSVVELVEQLEAQIERLTLARKSPAHLGQLQQAITAQQNEIRRLSRTIENKSKQLIQSKQLNHGLQKRIRELEDYLAGHDNSQIRKDSHNSNLPPALDLPWKKPKRTRSLRQKSGLPVGGQRGHKGSTLRQVSDPDEIIIHQVEKCSHCDLSLTETRLKSFRRRQIIEIKQGRRWIIEHRIEIKSCPQCVKTSPAEFPAGVKAPVQYGPSVFSRLVYLHLYQLLPVARTAETMKDLFACPLSLATVQRAVRFCSDKLVRCEQRIKTAILDSSVVGADETGVRINGAQAYVHVARTETLTHFGFHPKRGKIAFEAIGIINRFTGTLVRDGWFSYNWYQQCRHSLCNAHLLRDLTFIGESEPLHKAWTDDFAKLLIEIKDAVESPFSRSKSSLEEDRQRSFLDRYDVILAAAERDIRGSPKVKTKQLSAESLYKRLVKNKAEILRFMDDLAVPFDNNGSERNLRMLKLQQKVSGCFRTPDGAQTFCRVRSYLSSARKQGKGLLTAIEHALNGKLITLTC